MTEPKHSPWAVEEVSLGELFIVQPDGEGGWYPIAELSKDHDFAKAKLIVRRVNQGPKVDKLLEIAEELANLILGTQNLGYSNYTLAAGKAREFLKAKEG